MSKQNNAQRVINYYINGDYDFTKRDLLRLKDEEIYDGNTLIGMFKEVYNYELDMSETFLVLTLQDFKSQPSWKRHKKELAEAANKSGIKVIFVPMLDIGFGVNTYITHYTNSMNVYNDLIKVAKYSQDKDIKTAAFLTCKINGTIMSYNQLIDGEFKHAEQVIFDYCAENIRDGIMYSLLEPCCNCLKGILDRDIHYCYYGELHKPKWTTPEYIQLTNDIQNKEYNIKYVYEPTDKVHKFMNKKEK